VGVSSAFAAGGMDDFAVPDMKDSSQADGVVYLREFSVCPSNAVD